MAQLQASTVAGTLTTTGNVGIGTNNPGYPLYVYLNSNSGLLSTIRNVSTGTAQYVELKIGQGDSRELRIGSSYNYSSAEWNQNWIYSVDRNLALKTDNGYAIRFYTDGTVDANERMRIASGGNVGIGVTNPQAPLHVIAASSANDALIQEWSYTNTTIDQYSLMLKQTVTSGVVRYNFSMVNNNTAYNNVLVLDRGNVGIGTTNPPTKLYVAGNGEFTDTLFISKGANDAIQQGSSVYLVGGSGASYTQLQQGVGRFIIFGFNGSSWVERFTINNTSGNVGIGTNTPGLKLDVVGGTTGQPVLRLQSTDVDGYTGAHLYSSAGTLVGHFGWANGTTTTLSDKMYFGTIVNKPVVFTTNDTIKVRITAGGTLLVSGSVTPSEPNWKGTAVFGPDGQDKVIIGGLVSTYTGATIGGHNSALSAWADLNIVGGNLIFRYQETEYMRMNTSGNLGIGTATPLYKFHLQGSNLMATLRNSSTSANQYTQIEFLAGSREAYIWLGNQNTTSWAGDGGLNIYTGTGNMDFWTAASQRMRITSGGKVSIGTMTPGTKLDVVGGDILTGTTYATLRVTQDQTNYRGVVLGYDTSGQIGVIYAETPSAASNLAFWTYTGSSWGERMRINSNGNVGIGTANPTRRLDVQEGNIQIVANFQNTSTTSARIKFTDANTGAENVNIGATGTSLAMWTNNTVRMTILSGGNIGIGTASPIRDLMIGDLASTSTATPKTFSLGGTYSNTAGSNVKLRVYDDSSSTIGGMSVSGGQIEVNTWSTGKIAFYRGTTQTMIISDAGDVGINTAAPTHKLHVNGNLRVDDPKSFDTRYTPSGERGVDRIYGNSQDNFVLGLPDNWLGINVSGTAYVIPLYAP